MTIAQTHNTALKRLLEADESTVRRTAVAYAAQIAMLEKELKLREQRMAVLERMVNEQEQIIIRLRA
jgi:hypothetical protein